MATMKDVAKLAKVGVGTVSRVINNSTGVKQATRDRVEAAIKELGYVRDEYARGLKTNSSQTVALILPTIWNPFFAEFAYFVEQALYQHQYKVLLCNSSGDYEKEYQYIQMVTQNKVDGIVGITYSAIDQYVSSNLPFVSIDRYFTEDISYVTSENFVGGKLAAQQLLDHGAQHLAYISGYSKYKNETTRRRDGFNSLLMQKGIEADEIFVPEPVTDLPKLVDGLLKRRPDLDGIFCVNDLMLLQVKEILNQRNISVPDDIQMIGYDGFNLTSDQPLGVSTIKQPVAEMAQAAVNILLQKIKNPDSPSEIEVLPVTYREGWTTKNI